MTLPRKEKFEAKDFAEIATYFADQYRIYREMEPPAVLANEHERRLVDFVNDVCRDLEKNGTVRLRDALIGDLKNPDRVKWQLSLSEMLVRSGEEKKVDEAQTLLDAAVKDLSPADQKVHAAQIDRIRKELGKNKSDKK